MSGRHDTDTHELVLARTVSGSGHDVFERFSSPDHVSRWFTTKHEADVAVGGTYRNADGDHGRYLRVEAPTLLEFTWDNASHCPGTIVSVSFAEEAPGRTTVRLRHGRLASAQHVTEMEGGWSWALDSFRSYVETGVPITHEAWLEAKGS